jgi:hypothetical protein
MNATSLLTNTGGGSSDLQGTQINKVSFGIRLGRSIFLKQAFTPLTKADIADGLLETILTG